MSVHLAVISDASQKPQKQWKKQIRNLEAGLGLGSVIKALSASREKYNFPFILALVTLLLSSFCNGVTSRNVSHSIEIPDENRKLFSSNSEVETEGKDEIYLSVKTNRERSAFYPMLTSPQDARAEVFVLVSCYVSSNFHGALSSEIRVWAGGE